MKQDLYINQVLWFRKQAKEKLNKLSEDKSQGYVTEVGYRNARSRINGSIDALDMDFGKDIHNQVISNIHAYEKAEKDLKVNVLDDNDKNIGLFYLIGGAMMQSLLILTTFDNPQSCCPANKEILLGKTISSLEESLQHAMMTKDKKSISEIKKEIGIITKQYQDNAALLNKKPQTDIIVNE